MSCRLFPLSSITNLHQIVFLFEVSEGLKLFSLCGFLSIHLLQISHGISSVGFRWRRHQPGRDLSLASILPSTFCGSKKREAAPSLSRLECLLCCLPRPLAAVQRDYFAGTIYHLSFVAWTRLLSVLPVSSVFTCSRPI